MSSTGPNRVQVECHRNKQIKRVFKVDHSLDKWNIQTGNAHLNKQKLISENWPKNVFLKNKTGLKKALKSFVYVAIDLSDLEECELKNISSFKKQFSHFLAKPSWLC